MRFDLAEVILRLDERHLARLLDTWEDPADPRLTAEVRKGLLGVLPGPCCRNTVSQDALRYSTERYPFIRTCLAQPDLGADLRSSIRANLVNALLLDYERCGLMEPLEAAITESQALIREDPETGDELAGRLATLAHLNALRAAGFNSPSDLARSIATLKKAVEVPGLGTEKAAECWSNLAGAWRDEYARDRKPDVLLQAITALREAVRRAPPATRLGKINRIDLAGTQRIHAVLAGDLIELTDSISNLRALADEQRSVDPHLLYNLGLGYRERHRLTGVSADLEEAILALQAAFAGVASGQQLHAAIAMDLATALLQAEGGSEQALGLLDLVADHPAATGVKRFEAATTAAGIRSSADAFGYWRRAVNLLPILAWRGSRYQDRESAVGRFAGAARTGAACAVASGEVEEAIMMLETGLAVLWSQLLDARADLYRLREVAPGLAARLAAVRAELDRTHHL
ncbi:hypothetical protein ACVMYR_32455 [Micromonospora sp. PTRAS2]